MKHLVIVAPATPSAPYEVLPFDDRPKARVAYLDLVAQDKEVYLATVIETSVGTKARKEQIEALKAQARKDVEDRLSAQKALDHALEADKMHAPSEADKTHAADHDAGL